MRFKANNLLEYYSNIPNERKTAMNKLRQTISHNMPRHFEEILSYGIPAWVVPHSIFQVDTIAKQRNHCLL